MMPSQPSPTPTSTPHPSYRPVALIILDGWGLAPPGPGNAVDLADTPVYDRLLATYPHATLHASGRAVGLPEGQMGNSEVGHLNLGAGFVVDQDLTRLGEAIDDGAFYRNPVLVSAARHAKERGNALHLMGLVGGGGVHAHDRHVLALLELARQAGLADVYLHAFTDGRDTAPQSALGYVQHLASQMDQLGVGRFASVIGRYWAMDRDKRWDRTGKAWRAMVAGEGTYAPSAEAAIEAAYAAGTTDEFVEPAVMVDDAGDPVGAIRAGDAVVMFNFRADRMRQLLAAFTDPEFEGFPRQLPDNLAVVTMTEYQRGQRAPIAFPAADVGCPIARAVAEHGLRQLHTAETEKYAHVTYFFNGGREAPFHDEARALIPSPKVPTYDLQPAMSAEALTDGLVDRIGAGADDFIVVNYANPDMVGHTGVLPAAIRAIETVDACLGRVLEALDAAGGVALVTADHGNAEMMIDPATGGPHTAHTTNLVPVILVGRGLERTAPGAPALADGRLADVAPTLLGLLGLPLPAEMTGRDLRRWV